MTRTRNKQQELHRSDDNKAAFDELTLEEAVIMNGWGVDFECGNGHVETIVENY